MFILGNFLAQNGSTKFNFEVEVEIIQKLQVFGWCHLRFGPKSTVDLDKIRVEPGDDESTSIV